MLLAVTQREVETDIHVANSTCALDCTWGRYYSSVRARLSSVLLRLNRLRMAVETDFVAHLTWAHCILAHSPFHPTRRPRNDNLHRWGLGASPNLSCAG